MYQRWYINRKKLFLSVYVREVYICIQKKQIYSPRIL